MARTKSPAMRREPSDIHLQSNGVVHRDGYNSKDIPSMLVDKLAVDETAKSLGEQQIIHGAAPKEAGVLSLLFNVGGIYFSFLTWGILQERITTTTFGTASKPEKFTYPVFLNTIQSTFAALVGIVYLYTSTTHPHKPGRPAPIFPSRRILWSLIGVSITTSLASPFGYTSLQHIDYITFILAKSCKLLPVMALSTLFGTRHPPYKYMVVAAVTLGVAVFTLYNPSTASKAAKHSSKSAGRNQYLGLALLSVNLLFDGLTNSVQDHIFRNFKPYSGPQMMCAMNIISTALTSSYLLLAPAIAPTPLGQLAGMSSASGGELASAMAFIRAHPSVGWDVLGFSLCGALGQVFIYRTLANFSSLVLVTVTVTRKMLTMIISVLWFGHRITNMQLVGVLLVFCGIGGEAYMSHREKQEKARKSKARVLSEAGQERKKHGIEGKKDS